MNSSFTVSAKHNLATEDGEYIFAEEMIDRKLFGFKYEIKTVENVSEKGIYAPMTAARNYFILNSKGEKILAHCLAHIMNPTL
jgi:hypothetical protein